MRYCFLGALVTCANNVTLSTLKSDEQTGIESIKNYLNTDTDLDSEKWIWPQGYTTFFMLNSAEHEIFPAHKC